jgi:hypothetical protein
MGYASPSCSFVCKYILFKGWKIKSLQIKNQLQFIFPNERGRKPNIMVMLPFSFRAKKKRTRAWHFHSPNKASKLAPYIYQ